MLCCIALCCAVLCCTPNCLHCCVLSVVSYCADKFTSAVIIALSILFFSSLPTN